MSMIGSAAAAPPSASPCTARPSTATLDAVRNSRRCMRHILHEGKARLRSIAVGIAGPVAIMALTAFGHQSSPSNRQWPPAVQPVSNESPVLPPAEALKTFYMPPGYHVELVASEPMVQEPVATDWDLEGR